MHFVLSVMAYRNTLPPSICYKWPAVRFYLFSHRF